MVPVLPQPTTSLTHARGRRRALSAALSTVLAGALFLVPVVDLTAAGAAVAAPSELDQTPVEPSRTADGGATTYEGDLQMVGATWDAGPLPAGAELQVRTRGATGWTPWQELHERDYAPDADTPEGASVAPSTEPLWVGEASAAELRVEGAQVVPGLRLLTVGGEVRAADTNLDSGPFATADALAARPPVASRAQWGANENLKPQSCRTPSYNQRAKVFFVHHTADSNSYSAEQVPMMMRNLYTYALGTGYCDIPYNVIADKFGRLFEARSGGIDRAVRSGATGGFNADSWAISLLGDYSTFAVPPATYAAVRDMLAWKIVLEKGDALGTQVLTASGASGTTSRYPDGTRVTFPVISGHRDAGNTACPGQRMYDLLPRLRADVAATMGADPLGNLEAASTGFTSIRATGWTLDPETYESIYVWVNVDGVGGPALANRDRPDVGRAFPGNGPAHGFDVTVTAPPGWHDLCVHGVNAGAGRSSLIGCRKVFVQGHPTGNLERVTQQAVSASTATVTASGWSFDPDTRDPIYVWVDASGRGAPTLANRSRPDVGRAYPYYGANHGFTGTVQVPRGTTYRVCAYGVNVSNGADKLLGCQSLAVP